MVLGCGALSAVPACSQNAPGGGVIVQPGAPGQANKALTPLTAKADVRPPAPADVEFMQGMIMHHNQAVEMTELLKTRTHNPEVRELGKKIDVSQTDEMRWMKQWLTDRSLPISAPMPGMAGMDMDMPGNGHECIHALHAGHADLCQMAALRKASGPQFDHLFLTGMIQHHTGALTMVKQLLPIQARARIRNYLTLQVT